jgi:hypothetical protein
MVYPVMSAMRRIPWEGFSREGVGTDERYLLT